MKFIDIKELTRTANYRVNIPFYLVKENIDRYVTTYKLNLNPDFQRVHVWSEEQSIKYVEYILKGGFSGKEIYFNHPGWMKSFKGNFVLVDGKQRLNAICMFLENKLKIFNKLLYKDFEGRPSSLKSLKFCINDLETREEVLQWYLDINTGSVVHTKEEIEKVKRLLRQERKN